MRRQRMIKATAAIGLVGLLVAACGSDKKDAGTGASGSGKGLAVDVSKCTKPSGATVKLQLQWFTQAQFGGYFAAVDKGFYKDAGLDVQIVEGGVDIPPQKTLALSKTPSILAVRRSSMRPSTAPVLNRYCGWPVSLPSSGW